MRRKLFIAAFLCCMSFIHAVPPVTGDGDDKTSFPIINCQPKFPGGSAALLSWIENNLRYPVLAEEQRIEGNVVCTFWIEKDGSVKNAQVIRSSHELLSKEALRVLKFMPRWFPGRENGQAIRVRYTVPFTFRLVSDSINLNSLEIK